MSSKKKRVFYALYIVFFRLFRNTCQFLLCLFLAIEKKEYIYLYFSPVKDKVIFKYPEGFFNNER